MKRGLWFSLLLILSGCSQHSLDAQTFEVTKSGTVVEESSELSTVLRNAIMDENLTRIREISTQVDLNQIRLEDERPLELAIRMEKIKSIRGLRKLGADVALVSLGFDSLEEWAASLGTDKKKLIRAVLVSFDVEAQELLEILTTNNFRDVKALLDEGVDLNVHFENGETPLSFSIQQKLMMSLRALFMIPDLDVNLTNSQGLSPLRLARDFKLDPIVAELIKRGAQDE